MKDRRSHFCQIQEPHFFLVCPLIIRTRVQERQTNQPPQIVFLINNFKADNKLVCRPLKKMNMMELPWPMEGESPVRLMWAGRSGLHSQGWRWRIGKTFVACFPCIRIQKQNWLLLECNVQHNIFKNICI